MLINKNWNTLSTPSMMVRSCVDSGIDFISNRVCKLLLWCFFSSRFWNCRSDGSWKCMQAKPLINASCVLYVILLLCLCSGIWLKQDDNIALIPLNPKCFFGFMPLATFNLFFYIKAFDVRLFWWARRWRSFAHPTSEHLLRLFFVQKQASFRGCWHLIPWRRRTAAISLPTSLTARSGAWL